jgi:hypothetical protein
MTVMLMDNETDEVVFDVNFWHYRAIVEAIRSLHVLPDEHVNRLHEQFTGSGLSKDECRVVAQKLHERFANALDCDDRVLFDGTITKDRDDRDFHRSETDWQKNYSTNKEVLDAFIESIRKSNGFTVC